MILGGDVYTSFWSEAFDAFVTPLSDGCSRIATYAVTYWRRTSKHDSAEADDAANSLFETDVTRIAKQYCGVN